MSPILLLAGALVACPLVAIAQQAATAPSLAQVIDQRQSKMGRGGRELHAVEQAAAAGAELSTVASSIQWLAEWAVELPTLFTDGSHSEEGDARPTIWTDRAGFTEATERFRAATRALAEAAEANDREAVRIGVRRVWDSCNSCHAGYVG